MKLNSWLFIFECKQGFIAFSKHCVSDIFAKVGNRLQYVCPILSSKLLCLLVVFAMRHLSPPPLSVLKCCGSSLVGR